MAEEPEINPPFSQTPARFFVWRFMDTKTERGGDDETNPGFTIPASFCQYPVSGDYVVLAHALSTYEELKYVESATRISS
ncbi:MAG: hypothetical protein ABIK28_21535 [Planctomycetota bacterium]